MRYYKTIDTIPIWNLEKINETLDIRYLLKLDDYDELPEKGFDSDEMVKYYGDISEKLFQMFGLDESFINQARKGKDLLVLQLMVLSGDKSKKTMLKIKEEEFNGGKDNTPPATFNEKVVLLEAHFRKDFDVHKMSALKFYTYIQLYKKINATIQKKNKGSSR